MINQIYRGYTKTCERFYDTHTRKINKASFSHKRVTALLSLISWSCFCLLHFSLTFPLPSRKLSPFRRKRKNITSFGDPDCTKMQKKRKTKLTGRFIWLCYQCIERQVITTGFSFAICELRSRTHVMLSHTYFSEQIYCNVSSSQLILRDPELLLLLYLQNLARLKVAGSAAMNFKLAYVYQTPVTQSRKGLHAYFIAHHLLRSV